MKKLPSTARPAQIPRKVRAQRPARRDPALAFLLFLAALADPGWSASKALP